MHEMLVVFFMVVQSEEIWGRQNLQSCHPNTACGLPEKLPLQTAVSFMSGKESHIMLSDSLCLKTHGLSYLQRISCRQINQAAATANTAPGRMAAPKGGRP